ncbi:MAG: beta-hexosaminidase, partial [Aliifodinibius sp.]|nr:beta-hexosaminidase [candidate division Zixibacteria bacterium]NIT58495.1 beta-hexosaminidase [Fodinibius sp.]NIS46909.1 beta-hexosaminidase [candidate division Zixibacteria bacterium]NIU15053.1 beta-hexosaminidase [candidate division Zixibacteria bacterium]NIV13361.1 beta-hexosaminidase [Fodinibius sp.]
LFFGPSLDVAENPSEDLINAIGTRTFGGDPFWVSEMASAFTQGIKGGH